jgi:D-arabinose 1-dehydrogenase-like Zn-dependent alcohol dehydrogenase
MMMLQVMKPPFAFGRLSCLSIKDYYKFAPKGFHIIGFDGAGIVMEVGPQCTIFKPGDDVFYVSSTTRQGSAAEYLLVDERHCAPKPKSLDFVEAASVGLTFGTAYQSLVDRLEIKQSENVGILIVSLTNSLSRCHNRFCYLDFISNTQLTVLD